MEKKSLSRTAASTVSCTQCGAVGFASGTDATFAGALINSYNELTSDGWIGVFSKYVYNDPEELFCGPECKHAWVRDPANFDKVEPHMQKPDHVELSDADARETLRRRMADARETLRRRMAEAEITKAPEKVSTLSLVAMSYCHGPITFSIHQDQDNHDEVLSEIMRFFVQTKKTVKVKTTKFGETHITVET